ncbi:Protein of unknown function [Sulfitobacter brevis]|uniref:DUF1674 domain-containing protein n=2 Tax=Sulfitobacter brevis TaxID=74348 RepID=A0A1I1VTP0_9RHOB|nr:Protein of unknown function [Sulfitobacter brevis]
MPDPNPNPTPTPDLPPHPKPAPRPIPDTPAQPTPAPGPDLPNMSSAAQQSLPPAAQRALAEAEERRRQTAQAELPREHGGRDGPEPVRYGDWEKKGIAIDF